MCSRQELMAVSLRVLIDREKALLCTEGLKDEEGKQIEFWLPKSQIVYDEDSLEIGKVLDIEVPRWLIEEKGVTSGT